MYQEKKDDRPDGRGFHGGSITRFTMGQISLLLHVETGGAGEGGGLTEGFVNVDGSCEAAGHTPASHTCSVLARYNIYRVLVDSRH